MIRNSTRLLTPRALFVLESMATVFSLMAVLSTASAKGVPASLGALLAQEITIRDLAIGGCVFATWALLARVTHLYSTEPAGIFTEMSRVAKAVGAAAILLFAAFSQRADTLSALKLALEFGVLCFLGNFFIRVFTAAVTGRAWTTFRSSRTVVIVGTGPRALRVYRELQPKLKGGRRLLGFIDCREKSECSEETQGMYLGSLENLETFLLENILDEVIIALPVRSCYGEIARAIEMCQRCGVEVKYPTDTFPVLGGTLIDRQSSPEMVCLKPYVSDSRLFVKRCVDIFCSLCALIAFSPLMLVIAAAIKLTDKGPVIFMQERYGLGRRRFPMYKFRTMVVDAEARLAQLEHRNEAQGPIFKMRKDPRITPVGSFLRRTSLDELPQLFNVLIGHMSLVGPRPMSVRDVSRFNEAWLMRRFSAKPGLTCLWQVNGRSNTTFTKWMNLDMQYIENWSLRLDAQILAQTIPAVLKGSGAM